MGHQSHSFPTTVSSSTASTSATTSITTTAPTATATHTSTSPAPFHSGHQSQDTETLERHIINQLQHQDSTQLRYHPGPDSSQLKMSDPNAYGSQGGSSSRSTPDNRGKGSADQEILDGLLPRIETRGQSSRHHSKKNRDGKKKSGHGSSRQFVNPSDPSACASASAPAGPSRTAPTGSEAASAGMGPTRRTGQEADTVTVEKEPAAPMAAAPALPEAHDLSQGTPPIPEIVVDPAMDMSDISGLDMPVFDDAAFGDDATEARGSTEGAATPSIPPEGSGQQEHQQKQQGRSDDDNPGRSARP